MILVCTSSSLDISQTSTFHHWVAA